MAGPSGLQPIQVNGDNNNSRAVSNTHSDEDPPMKRSRTFRYLRRWHDDNVQVNRHTANGSPSSTEKQNHNPARQLKLQTTKTKHAEAPTDSSTEVVRPIYVVLIRRRDNSLELTMTQGGPELFYETLSKSQRQAVQKCLLANDIWKQMLAKCKDGSSFTPHTLMSFRRLLPPAELQHFFSMYAAAKELRN